MDVQRRTVLRATGLVAVGGVVAACGSSGAAASSPAAPASSAAAGGVAMISDIPVGGGLILGDEAIVLTQPTDGDVKAFTAICTHQGCLVSSVKDNQIMCPCHGSIFSGTDGSVIQGPATLPLASAGVTIDAGRVVLNG